MQIFNRSAPRVSDSYANSFEYSIGRKIPFMIHLTGDYSGETKTLMSRIVDSQKSSKHFIPMNFNSWFLFPFSSFANESLENLETAGQIEVHLSTRGYEGIHKSIYLTPIGINQVQREFQNNFEEMGESDFSNFLSRQTALANAPIEYSVGLGIHHGTSGYLKNRIELEESNGNFREIIDKPKKEDVEELVRQMRKSPLFYPESVSVQSDDKTHIISYSISQDMIEGRFKYLKIDPEDIDSSISEYKSMGGDKDAIVERVLQDGLKSNVWSHERERRTRIILEKYPKAATGYVDEMLSILETLRENLDPIMQSFDYSMDMFKTIAQRSKKHKIKCKIDLKPYKTSIENFVEPEIKDAIYQNFIYGGKKRVWDRGLDNFVNSMAQVHDRLFLIGRGYKREYLEESMAVGP